MTLYEILEVSEKASNEVIEKAYKTLAKKYHPDLQQTAEDKKNAEKKMQKINEAYETLKDESKRSEYDRKLQEEKDNQVEYYQYNNMQQNIIKQKNYDNNTQTSAQQPNYNLNNNYRSAAEWQQILSNLSPKDRDKLMKKIRRDAKEEYTKVAEDYYRQQGYRIIHKTTPREYLARFITIIILIVIGIIIWFIPPTHNWLVKLYNENTILKIIVDMVISLVENIFSIFKN